MPKPCFLTPETHYPLVLSLERAVSKQGYFLLKLHLLRQVDNHKLINGRYSSLCPKVKPDVVAVSVDIVLQQQIQVPRLSVLEDAVEVASFEVRRKGKRSGWVWVVQVVKGNDLIVSDAVADVSNED